MTGIVYRFDDSVIRYHLARLMLLHASGFDSVRREIGEYMIGEIQDAFDEQKLEDGSPMPPSRAALTGAGRKGHTPGKTLIDKHHLYDSYVYQLAGVTGIEVGSALIYAAIHHFGGETGRKGHRFNLPPRPVMGLGDRRERAIGSFLLDELKRAQM